MTDSAANRINKAAARIAALPPDTKAVEKARAKEYVRNSTALDEGALMRRVAERAGR